MPGPCFKALVRSRSCDLAPYKASSYFQKEERKHDEKPTAMSTTIQAVN